MLSEVLKTKIFKYLGEKTSSFDWEINYPEIHSNESIVYRLSSPTYAKDFALKVYHKENPVRKRSHYDALERFAISLNAKNSKYRVPQPFGLFIEDNCFLMEWVAGISLRDALWKNCMRKGPAQGQINQAYSWLKTFHSHANLHVKQVDVTTYQRNLENNCERIGAQSFVNNSDIFQSGLKTLNKFGEHFKEHKTLHADIHGDLNLGNIILDNSYVTGIDIGAAISAPVENDIAQMLNYICINYFNMLPRTDMRKPFKEWEILNVVLDSYGYSTDEKSRNFFIYVFLYQVLRRWLSVQDIHKPNRDHAAKFKMLGRWRLHNSSALVQGLTKSINERFLTTENHL